MSINKSDTLLQANVPSGLAAYFEFTLIRCFAICDFCSAEQSFTSNAKQYSDQWYLDMAVAIKNANWIIPELQMAACPQCAASRNLRHDSSAHR